MKEIKKGNNEMNGRREKKKAQVIWSKRKKTLEGRKKNEKNKLKKNKK